METKSKIDFISANKINIVKDYIKLRIIKLIMIIIKLVMEVDWWNESTKQNYSSKESTSISLNFHQKSRRGYKLREISETKIKSMNYTTFYIIRLLVTFNFA